MKTVLFFVSSTRHSCFGRLDGVLRYGAKHDWHVQVIERAFRKVDVRETLNFWNPDGVIAECGSGAKELNRRAFGASCVIRRKSTRHVGKSAFAAKTGVVARGLDFIRTDAGKGIGVMDVVQRMGVIRCTAEVMFKAETGKTILNAINDRIYELAKVEFAKGYLSVKTVAAQLAVSRNTLDRIFVRRTGHPAGGKVNRVIEIEGGKML